MDKKMKKEELQSRREFFKKAAKGALPILAAVALAGAPSVMHATQMQCVCDGACMGSCKGTCRGTCDGKCMGTCKGTCQGTCKFGSK